MQIPLSKGLSATVDLSTYLWLSQYRWHAIKGRKGRFYAATKRVVNGKNTSVLMHRMIMNAPKGMQVDHIDETQTLDNRRDNLRLATHGQNQMNTGKHSHNTSGYKGVCWSKQKQKWRARIVANKKYHNLGFFSTPEAAYQAVCMAIPAIHGEFAHI